MDTIASDDNVAGECISILRLDRNSGTGSSYIDHTFLEEDLILVLQVFVQDLEQPLPVVKDYFVTMSTGSAGP